jgi:osmotically-inducible protein OsmY
VTQTIRTTDQELQTAVIEELRYTPGVDAPGIDVLVSNGTVTLSGKVTSLPGRLAAYHAVMRVAGVTNLVDQLTVDARAIPTASDSELARAAGQILRWSTELPPDAVTAEVHDRRVTLSGHVTWDYQRHAAVRAVMSLRGITAVINKITLDQPEPTHEARTQVEAALRRQSDLDAGTIIVEISGGQLTLRGTVVSWTQRRQAERVAWSAVGVTSVANHLLVTS